MKNKFSLREKIFFSPWALLTVLICGIGLINVVAFAGEDEVVGYTHDGLEIRQSDIPDESVEQYIAKGLRQLDIDVTLQKGLKANVLNENTLELFINNDVYTILVNCVNAGTTEAAMLTAIDFFDWAVVEKIEIGSKALVTRNPVKNFGNPAIKDMIEKNDIRLSNWDFRPRTCTVVGIQKKTIKVPEALEDIRG